ncbi:Ff.00g054690.m01.CDS01 [Fusarium sp. VM40]|nr:Ff.00g054690.m01.CDS01 [Fusarium sp. VM40]
MQRATIHTNETTITAGSTATVYTGGTSSLTAVVATTVTKAAPSLVVIPETEVHCGVLGYSGSPPVLVTVGSFSFDQCKAICTDRPFFGINPVKCRCYGELMKYSVIMETNSDIVFYDMLCASASEPTTARSPAKRAVGPVKVPDFLPSKSPSDVSSACSCLIKKPSAPVIITTTAKAAKTVTTTLTRQTTALVSKQLSSFVINKKTSTPILALSPRLTIRLSLSPIQNSL